MISKISIECKLKKINKKGFMPEFLRYVNESRRKSELILLRYIFSDRMNKIIRIFHCFHRFPSKKLMKQNPVNPVDPVKKIKGYNRIHSLLFMQDSGIIR